MNTQAALESLLFVSGDSGLSIQDISTLLDIPTESVEQVIGALRERYDNDDTCGLAIVSFAGRYQIVTKGEYAHIIKQYAISPFATRLSQAALETLAIIAYKQPLTRAKIDEIRGVQSSGALQKLQMRDLIESKGRENSPGKPILYGTTDYFMNYFGISDMSQLPDISQMEEVSHEELHDLFGQRYENVSNDQLKDTREDKEEN